MSVLTAEQIAENRNKLLPVWEIGDFLDTIADLTQRLAASEALRTNTATMSVEDFGKLVGRAEKGERQLAELRELMAAVLDALAKHCRGNPSEPTTIKNVAAIVDRICQLDEEKQQRIQELTEPMDCGHPRACWEVFEYTESATEYDSAGYAVPVPIPAQGEHCTACAREREAVAQAYERCAAFAKTDGLKLAEWEFTKWAAEERANDE